MSTTEKQVREVEGVVFAKEPHTDSRWTTFAVAGVYVSHYGDGDGWVVGAHAVGGLPPADATRFSAAIAAAAKLATQLNDEAGQQVTKR